jgi:hypothetical protein
MAECVATACSSKAAVEANKATARILVRMLVEGSDSAKAVAAKEIRLLAKAGKQNQTFIAELGAIPLLCRLLPSTDQMAQENAVTALLNLSIYERAKQDTDHGAGGLLAAHRQRVAEWMDYGGQGERSSNSV